MSEVSPGEVGGVFAGVVALLATLGAGIKWFLGWAEQRADSRARKLQAWHDELEEREARFEQREAVRASTMERRLELIEAQHEHLKEQNLALRLAFDIVAGELRQRDPENASLKRADELLKSAFPLLPAIPGDMLATVAEIDRAESA